MGEHEACDDSSEMSYPQVGTRQMGLIPTAMSTLKKYGFPTWSNGIVEYWSSPIADLGMRIAEF